MPHRLAQQRMTFSDLKWPFHASRAISAVAEHLVFNNAILAVGNTDYSIFQAALAFCTAQRSRLYGTIQHLYDRESQSARK